MRVDHRFGSGTCVSDGSRFRTGDHGRVRARSRTGRPPTESRIRHDGFGGPFHLLDFAEARSVGYIEYRDGGVLVQNRNDVEVYDLLAERLSEQALTDADSAALIRARIEALT